MAAQIIDGKKISEEIRSELRSRVESLVARGIQPGLAVVLVGEDPASVSYVTGKERACAELGIASLGRHMSASSSESEVISVVGALNADPRVHGILVQIPLPKGLDERRIIAAIDPDKDMDGLTPENMGRLVLEEPGYLPCTPAGVIELLKRTGVETRGARVVIVGRSSLVGRPLVNLMLRKSVNATVTVCHTGTRDNRRVLPRGRYSRGLRSSPEFIRGDWIKKGACVIDVGMSRVEDALLSAAIVWSATGPMRRPLRSPVGSPRCRAGRPHEPSPCHLSTRGAAEKTAAAAEKAAAARRV
jgi:methylenetetrahydrofolate dehydrogenase (NADP+)/methenyltetrahydrofolate cyclohydrolase